MSDPYSPYQVPGAPHGYPMTSGYGQQYPAAPPIPGVARAAAIFMAVVGALILLGSVLMAVVIANAPIEMLEEAGALKGIPPEMDVQTALNLGASCIGACGGMFGLLYLVMSPFVWRGGRGSSIASAVIVGMSIASMLLLGMGGLVQGGPQAVPAAVFYLLLAMVLGVLLFLLIRAVIVLRQRQMQALAGYQMAWPGYYPQEAQPPAPSPPSQQSQPGSGWDPPQGQ